MATNKTLMLVIFLIAVFIIIKLALPFSDSTANLNFSAQATKQMALKTDAAIEQTQHATNEPALRQEFITKATLPGEEKSKLSTIADHCTRNADLLDIADLARHRDNYLTELRLSKSHDDKLALLMQNDQLKTEADTDAIFQLPPTSLNKALLFEQQLAACSKNYNPINCNEELYLQAQHIDKDNGYLWYLMAAIHLSQNKINDATAAIRVANSKANYNEYYFEKIDFFQQSFQQHSALNFNVRLANSIGIAAISLQYSTIIDYCRARLSDIVIADLCLDMGIKLEQSSKTRIGSSLGLALQEIIYHHELKADLLSKTREKGRIYEDNYFTDSDFQATEILMTVDERLGRTWLNAGLAKGEAFSFAATIKEAKTFAEDENYQPCQ